jgi:ubiquinone/menaquinone biosynthesis C-methylase UbiE
MTIQIDPEGNESKRLQRLADFQSARILEVGCGDGRLTWRYAGAAEHVTGVDLHGDDLRVALLDRPANLAQSVRFARADAVHLPFRSDAFDLAIFSWSF